MPIRTERGPEIPFDLVCARCKRPHSAEQLQNLCTDCGRPLLVRYDLDPEKGARLRVQLDPRDNSLWRYRHLLPVRDHQLIVSLGEGFTPLLPAPRLAKRVGLHNLYIKDESGNPTGSFKARGMSVAISRAFELDARRFCLPSAGNAAVAAAAYCSAADTTVRVYMPDDSGEFFFASCCAFGAEVVAVMGTIADCGHLMREQCDPGQWFDLSTLREPYRVEGKKTMGYELWEDFGSNGTLPDVIVYPTGGGTGLIGMWKAFDEMKRLGWIADQRPRMICVQAEGCAPIVRAFHNGSEAAAPFENPQTAALGLRVPSAIGDFLILRALRDSKGHALTVTEDEWAEGQSWLAADLGLFASPEGGAAIAGLKKAVDDRIVQPDERVVVFNTGSAANYPPSVWPKPLGTRFPPGQPILRSGR